MTAIVSDFCKKKGFGTSLFAIIASISLNAQATIIEHDNHQYDCKFGKVAPVEDATLVDDGGGRAIYHFKSENGKILAHLRAGFYGADRLHMSILEITPDGGFQKVAFASSSFGTSTIELEAGDTATSPEVRMLTIECKPK